MNSLPKSSHLRVLCAAIAIGAGIGLAFASIPGKSHAQTVPANVELAQLVPSNVDQFFEFNTAAANPFTDAINSAISSFISNNSSSLSATDAQTLEGIVNNELKSNLVSSAIKQETTTATDGTVTPGEPDTYFSIHLTADDYNKLTTVFSDQNNTKEVIDGMNVYDLSTNMFGTYIGDLFIVTDNHADMSAMLDMYTKQTGTSLAQNAEYTAVRQKDLQGSFLNTYINFAGIQNEAANLQNNPAGGNMMGLFTAGKNILSALNAEGLSVAQSNTGFNFGFIIKGDGTKLTQLNLNFDRYNFVPLLYKYVNGNNVMLFSERNNLENQLQLLENLFESDPGSSKSFTDWKNQFKLDSGIDFDNDIPPLFGGEYTFSIHKTGQIYPAFTFVADVRSMQAQASNVLAKLMVYVDKSFTQMEQQKGVNFYNKSTAYFNGSAYYQMTFDPTKSTDTPSQIKNLSPDKTLITVNAAVTPQGFLVITNSPNVNDVFTLDGQGMMNNSGFAGAFTTPGENTIGLGYVSFDVIKNYTDMLLNTFSAPATMSGFIDGILSPWHDLYTKAYGTVDTAWGNGFVNVDTAGLANYGSLFTTYFTSLENSYATQQLQMMPPPASTIQTQPVSSPQFCDVKPSDWDAQYVNALAAQGIITGYSDGCFHPNSNITRAEFITMIMNSLAGSYNKTNFDYNKKYFTDIEDSMDGANEWYADKINIAAANGYIKGYSDGSFRPDAPITRAEAVEIIDNVLHQQFPNMPLPPTVNTMNFTDVKSTDWFMPALKDLYQDGIVSGSSPTTFAPSNDLTRAEAAKIVNGLMNFENGNQNMQNGTQS